jgi:hypothetical protein
MTRRTPWVLGCWGPIFTIIVPSLSWVKIVSVLGIKRSLLMALCAGF